jgi:hypothetical protein
MRTDNCKLSSFPGVTAPKVLMGNVPHGGQPINPNKVRFCFASLGIGKMVSAGD